MTLTEFKAWLEGFGEHIAEAPTPEQWTKIKAKIEATEIMRPAPPVTAISSWPGVATTSGQIGGYVSPSVENEWRRRANANNQTVAS